MAKLLALLTPFLERPNEYIRIIESTTFDEGKFDDALQYISKRSQEQNPSGLAELYLDHKSVFTRENFRQVIGLKNLLNGTANYFLKDVYKQNQSKQYRTNKTLGERNIYQPEQKRGLVNRISNSLKSGLARLQYMYNLAMGSDVSDDNVQAIDLEIKRQMNSEVVPSHEEQNQFAGFLMLEEYKVVFARKFISELVDQAIVSHLNALQQVLNNSELLRQQVAQRNQSVGRIRNIDRSLTDKDILRYSQDPIAYFNRQSNQFQPHYLVQKLIEFTQLVIQLESYMISQKIYLNKQSLVYEHATLHNGMYLIPFRQSTKFLYIDPNNPNQSKILEQIAGSIRSRPQMARLSQREVNIITNVVLEFFVKKFPGLIKYLGTNQEMMAIKIRQQIKDQSTALAQQAQHLEANTLAADIQNKIGEQKA